MRTYVDDSEEVRYPPRWSGLPLRALAYAVLLQAMRDARDGDAEAAAWVTDPRAVELWAVAAEREPAKVALLAARVLRPAAA